MVLADVPPERKPERGHVRQNHPFTKPPFYLPVRVVAMCACPHVQAATPGHPLRWPVALRAMIAMKTPGKETTLREPAHLVPKEGLSSAAHADAFCAPVARRKCMAARDYLWSVQPQVRGNRPTAQPEKHRTVAYSGECLTPLVLTPW